MVCLLTLCLQKRKSQMDFINDIMLSTLEDRELNEYKVLNFLKACRKNFNENRLYPDLTELRIIASKLKSFLNQKTLDNSTRQYSVKNSTKKGSCISLANDDYENISEIVKCSLSHLTEVIEEGYIIYDFVSSNIEVNLIGDLPEYYDEGYLLIPDNRSNQLSVYQYVSSTSITSPIPLQSLNTSYLMSIPGCDVSLTSKKFRKELVLRLDSFIDPAIFVCLTDLSFDIPHTILPIAKKKLLDIIF